MIYIASIDGSKIAYISDIDGNNEIYIMNIDGSDKKNITNSNEDELCPTFSPDGQKIAFSSGGSICIMNSDGSDRFRISCEGFCLYPCFFPELEI